VVIFVAGGSWPDTVILVSALLTLTAEKIDGAAVCDLSDVRDSSELFSCFLCDCRGKDDLAGVLDSLIFCLAGVSSLSGLLKLLVITSYDLVGSV
jgi:hypothetical protein